MNKFAWLFLLVGFVAFLGSCRKQPVASRPEQPAKRRDSLKIKEAAYVYITLKSKLNYSDSTNKLGAVVNTRMKKDSIIWMSITPGLGIEALRVMIRPDSIFILDRLNNNAYAYPFSYIQNELHADVDFYNLQNLIVGNMPFALHDSDMVVKDSIGSFYYVSQQRDSLKIENFVAFSNEKLYRVLFARTGMPDRMEVKYDQFNPTADSTWIMPYFNEIDVSYSTEGKGLKSLKLTIEHSKIEISPKPLNFPFNVPKKFDNR
jgi:hypothetical protein